MRKIHQHLLILNIFTATLTNTASSLSTSTTPKHGGSAARPIPSSGWPDKFPAKSHCSKCGLCETSFVESVTSSCAFLNEGMARIDSLEHIVHGRTRIMDDDGDSNEIHFGVQHEPMQLVKGSLENAQWTGAVSSIAISMLELGMVDAVVCIASGGDDADGGWSEPEPILAKTVADVLRGRGVKPALAPSLRVLDEIKNDDDVQRILFCGVGCAVQAFRAVQDDLGLEEVYVLGTNCADNSPTPQAARDFMKLGLGLDAEKVQGYEFMQDFRVHVKMARTTSDEDNDDGSGSPQQYKKLPYFCLPGSVADAAIADSCLACFDYTNALADVVIGYMASPLDSDGVMSEAMQSLTIRNERGKTMVQTAINAKRITLHGEAAGAGSHEKISIATLLSDNIVLAMTGGKVKEAGMPKFLGEAMAFVMRNIGPTGVNFAKYSIDYHLLRNYLHVLDEWGEKRAEKSIPTYAKKIFQQYCDDSESVVDLRNQILAKK